MDAVLQQPAARRAYRQRGMVERTIARLRQTGLSRFRRCGIKAVRVEFAIHRIAYNLGGAPIHSTLAFHLGPLAHPLQSAPIACDPPPLA